MSFFRYHIRWIVVWAIWSLGGLFLWILWNLQKSFPDPLGSYIEFALMFVFTFYPFALVPIKSAVDRIIGGYPELSSTPGE
jgi:hypothetical protein